MFKRLLALGLALTMVVSLSMATLAADTSKGTYDFCTTQLGTLATKFHNSFVSGLQNKNATIKVDITGKKEEEVVTAFQQAVQMIIEQHAEIFWLDTSMQNFVTSSDHKTLFFYPRPKSNYGTANETGSAASKLNTTAITNTETKMQDIAKGIKGTTRYEIVKNIQATIIAKSEYNASTKDKQSYHEATGVLIDGSGVCDGYAKSFKYLCDQKGVPALVVGGTATNALGQNGTHAWNYVKMEDDKWYAVDTGWDDPVVASGASNAKYNYVYFLKNNIKNDARKKDNYKYPALASTDYKAA